MRVCGLRMFLVSVMILGACGGNDDSPSDADDGPVTPPERPERQLPALELPEENPTVPEMEPTEAQSVEVDESDYVDIQTPCCEVAFALPDKERTDDEVSGVLIGTMEPLAVDGGLPLTYSDGAWRATACVSPDTSGQYQYVISIDDGTEEAFESTRLNPYVRSGYSMLGESNFWDSGDMCEDVNIAIHGVVDE